MRIVIPSSPERFKFPYRIVANAGRYDTISGCVFLDDSRIVCADRQMARIYLVKYDLEAGTHAILDERECVLKNEPQNFELLAYHDNTIYSVSYRNTLFSCKIKDDKFCEFKLTTIQPRDNYHGLCYAGGSSLLLTNMLQNTIVEYNVATQAKRAIKCEGGVRMKDVSVVDSQCILALSSDSGPTTGRLGDRVTPYASHVLLLERTTGKLIRKHTMPATQIDGCAITSPSCKEMIACAYVTATDSEGIGYILRLNISLDYEFIGISRIEAAGFPHGVDISGGVLAYTSYTESALYIQKMG
jgi:hypothetical protein